MKYVGLLALTKITSTHANLASDYHDLIVSCIDDADISIRLRALDLLVGMVTRDSLTEIVKQLMLQLLEPPPDSTSPPLPDYYRVELVRRILAMSTRDNYSNIGNNFEWYVAVLVDLARIAKVDVGGELSEEIMNVTVRVKSVRGFSVRVLRDLLRDFEVMSGGAEKAQGQSEVLGAAAWIVGEYCRYRRIQTMLIVVYWIIRKRRWRPYYLRMCRNVPLEFSQCIFKLYLKSSLPGQPRSRQLGLTTGKSRWSLSSSRSCYG